MYLLCRLSLILFQIASSFSMHIKLGSKYEHSQKHHSIPAACSYWRWGGSGRQENINAICILGLNIVNDKVSKHNLYCQCIILILNDNIKVFLILWWWFLLLVLIGLVRLVYRAVQCRSKSCLLCISGELLSLSCCRSAWLRYHLLTMRLYQNFKKSTKVEQIKVFVKAAKLGDWWVNMWSNNNRQINATIIPNVT